MGSNEELAFKKQIASNDFKSTRSLALHDVALEYDKAIFFEAFLKGIEAFLQQIISYANS